MTDKHERDTEIRLKLLAFLSGPIFAIFLGVIPAIVVEITSEGKIRFAIHPMDAAGMVWVFIAFFSGYVIGQLFDYFNESKSIIVREKKMMGAFARDKLYMDGQIEKIAADIKARSPIRPIKNNEVLNTVRNVLENSHRVKNTYIGISEQTGVGTASGGPVSQLYEIILNKQGGDWEDLVGVSDFFNGRYNIINPDLKSTYVGSHNLYVLTNNWPVVINFILCGPESGPMTDVLFGWILDGSANEVSVFHSSDAHVVRMFSTYFEQLKSSPQMQPALKVDYNVPVRERFMSSRVSQFRGVWCQVDGAALRSSSKTKQYAHPKANDAFSIVWVSYRRDHPLNIEGWTVFGEIYAAGQSSSSGSFTSEMCSLVGNKLYYSFSQKDVDGNPVSTGLAVLTLRGDDEMMDVFYAERNSAQNDCRVASKILEWSGNPKRDRQMVLDRFRSPFSEGQGAPPSGGN